MKALINKFLYKHKQQSSVNAYKYFFSNPICDIWNVYLILC